MRWRDLFRPGVLTNGWLQSVLEKKAQAAPTSTVQQLQSSGFHTKLIERMLRKLTKVVEQLKWTPEQTQWTHYDLTMMTHYDDSLCHYDDSLMTHSS